MIIVLISPTEHSIPISESIISVTRYTFLQKLDGFRVVFHVSSYGD